MDVSAIEVPAAGGVVLRGERWSGDAAWYVLLHDLGGDIDIWRPLQDLVERQGRSAVALDLRGHGGSDDGDRDLRADAEAAVGYAREAGAQALVIVAEGDSATEALRAASEFRPDALVLLSPRRGGTAVAELRAPGVARLFLYGAVEQEIDETVAGLRNAAIGWAGSIAFPTDVQGAALLGCDWGGHALEQLASFVDEQVAIACR